MMRCSALDPRLFRSLPILLRALALVGLCLLPMQMRAGAGQPHPHALLHLLLDARDGSFDHHRDGESSIPQDQTHTADSADETDHARPDLPTFGNSLHAGGGLAGLLVLLIALLLPPATNRVWPPVATWRGRLPGLDPPPPRFSGICA
jgi:hypothetical protein